jgi:hypothetical protein
MTDTFRALRDQLFELAEGKRYDGSAVIAKTRAALAKQPEPASPSVGRMLALQDQIRDGALTLTDALKEIRSGPICSGPESPLVERVAWRIGMKDVPGFDNWLQARAAILEVAAWLRGRNTRVLASVQIAGDLEEEANR